MIILSDLSEKIIRKLTYPALKWEKVVSDEVITSSGARSLELMQYGFFAEQSCSRTITYKFTYPGGLILYLAKGPGATKGWEKDEWEVSWQTLPGATVPIPKTAESYRDAELFFELPEIQELKHLNFDGFYGLC